MHRILVIDDQKDVRAMIAIVLRLKQFEVIEAESAAAGLKIFRESPADLAIVDIFLQDACGFDVISKMRDLAPRLPVVAISSMATLDGASQSAELLNVVCLQKPFRPNDLISAIDAASRRVQASAGEDGGRKGGLIGHEKKRPGEPGRLDIEACAERLRSLLKTPWG